MMGQSIGQSDMKYNHTSRISKRIILSSEPFAILSTMVCTATICTVPILIDTSRTVVATLRPL